MIKGRDDMRDVAHFLTDNALKRFDTNAPSLLDRFCVAYLDDELVACCGATLARDRTMYLEKIYKLGHTITEDIAEDRGIFCEIGRWMSHVADLAPQVLKGIIEHAQSEGAQFAICEMVAPSMRRAKSLGLPFAEVESDLVLANVDPIARKYYEEHTPQLYKLDLAAIDWR